MSIQERISPISSNYTTSPASSPETVTEAKGVYVGELQEKWQFPSDHLPIGLTYKYLNFASWNVLDSSLMHWVTVQNSQGLSRSLIAKQHYYVGGSGVTFRELRIINDIHYMLFDNSLPRSLIALQECSYPFLQALKDKLPSYIDLISTSKGECILLNKYSFQILNCMELSGVFPTTPRKTIQEIWIRSIHRNMNFRIINAHLPGDPNKPGRFEFAEFLRNSFDPNVTTIVMGDMNFDEIEMKEAISEAFPECIDHFLFYSPTQSTVVINKPHQVLPDLEFTANLLTIDTLAKKAIKIDKATLLDNN